MDQLSQSYVRFSGGPFEGVTLGVATWPPPENVLASEISEGYDELDGVGKYVVQSKSNLSEEEANDMHVARAALYQWIEES